MYRQIKTTLPKASNLKKQWLIFDAKGKTLGRLAAEITKVLRGKHKSTFTPHMDCGDGVIVINAEGFHLSGDKEVQKELIRYTGFMKGIRRTPLGVWRARNPAFVIEHAVKGMMPKTRLARAQLKHLRICAGTEHGLDAQQPILLNI